MSKIKFMDGDGMKRRGHKSFWGQKQILIAGAVMLIAAAAMTFVYVANSAKDNKQELAQAEDTEKQENKVQTAKKESVKKDTEQPAKSVTKVVKPKEQKKEETANVKEETESEQEPKDTEQTANETVATSAAVQLHFDEGAGLNWPLQGDVILNYSMDQTIYFATLDQYKYNPAVVIAGNVSDPVSNAASGKITDISTNEVTGCTVSVDLGDGFTAIYGQLKDVPYQVGDYVENGSTIGFISEPTKYYSLEGSNLYFELQKDGAPVNPVSYFQ